MKVRTRFAPSPTGFMHIGNLRTAIFEYLLAKKYEGSFILRIEDTDQTRQVEGAIDFIYKTLELCGFTIDEGPMNEKEYGPYIQSQRKDLYKKYALELVEKGHAYYCFCTEEELEAMREKANEKIEIIYNVNIEQFNESDGKISSVVLDNGTNLEVNGVFIYIGYRPNTDLVDKYDIINNDGYVLVDDYFETTIPGVFAIGDIIKKDVYQLVTAASDGAIVINNIDKSTK